MRISFGRQPEFANDLRIELFDEQRRLSKLIKTLRLRQYQRFQDVTSAMVELTLHDFAVIIHNFIVIINFSMLIDERMISECLCKRNYQE